MTDSVTRIAPGLSPPPAPSWRVWLRCVLTAEIILIAVFAACTFRLLHKNADANPTITTEVTRNYLAFTYWYSAGILAGYCLVGLVWGSFCWAIVASWGAVRNRPPSKRGAILASALLIALMSLYMTAAYAVHSPQVLENILTSDDGLQAIVSLGRWTPPWLLTLLRGAFEAASCVLIVAGLTCAIRRMNHPRRRAALTLTATLPIIAAGLGLGLAIDRLPAKNRHDSHPNILILATDGLRQDHLGAYGYPKPTSPNIDRLAADAVRFNEVYVPQARTLPSWTSILTGTYPHTHGQRFTWPRESHIPMPLATLPRELARQGYASYAISDWVGGDFAKVDFGFTAVHVAPEAWSLKTWIAQAICQGHPLLVALADNPLGYRLYPAMEGMPINPNPENVTQETLSTLGRLARRDQPFFMIVFYSETHLPYATRYPYYQTFASPAYQGRQKLNAVPPSLEDAAGGKFDPDAYFNVAQLRALYDGAILSFDDQVGQVVASLKNLNLWDDTIVIITSDHGENLLESPSSWGHGNFLFDANDDSRIPLIISDPALRGSSPRSIDEVTSSVNLMPTLLQRLGLPAPDSCEGRSFADLLRGQRPPRDGTIFAESAELLGGEKQLTWDSYLRYPPLAKMLEVTEPASGLIGIKKEYFDLLIEARQRMVRTSRWKLLYAPLVEGARYQLFDLQADPLCRSDVQDAHPQVFADLRAALWDWMKGDSQRRQRGDHLVPRALVGKIETAGNIGESGLK